MALGDSVGERALFPIAVIVKGIQFQSSLFVIMAAFAVALAARLKVYGSDS
jgi:hypothetical protein